MSKPKQSPPPSVFGINWREFYEAHLARTFPSEEAFRWWLRKYRKRLAEEEVLVLIGNVPFLDPERFLPVFSACVRDESLDRVRRLKAPGEETQCPPIPS